jgi:hypothetical protein
MGETEGRWKGDLFVRTSKRLDTGERIECLCDPAAHKKNANALYELYKSGKAKGCIVIDFPIQGLKNRFKEDDEVRFQEHGSWHEAIGTITKVQTFDGSCEIKHSGNEMKKSVPSESVCHAFCSSGLLKGRIGLVLANFTASKIQDTTRSRYGKDWLDVWAEAAPVWSMGIVQTRNADMSYKVKLESGGYISAQRDILRVSRATTHAKPTKTVSANAGYKVGERVKWKNVELQGGKRKWSNSGEAAWTEGIVASAKVGSYSIRYGPTSEAKSTAGKLRGLDVDITKLFRDDTSAPADLKSAEEQVEQLEAAKEAGDKKGNRKLAKLKEWVRLTVQLADMKGKLGVDCGVPLDCVKRVPVDPHKKAMKYWAKNEENRRRKEAAKEKRAAAKAECVKTQGWRAQTLASSHQMKTKNATLLEKG